MSERASAHLDLFPWFLAATVLLFVFTWGIYFLILRYVPDPPMALKDVPLGLGLGFAAIPGSSVIGFLVAAAVLRPLQADLGRLAHVGLAVGAGLVVAVIVALHWARRVRRAGLRPAEVSALMLRGRRGDHYKALEQPHRDRRE